MIPFFSLPSKSAPAPQVQAAAGGNLITCQNAAFGYNGQIVVRDLNFSIQRGDYICVVGENGSGKSTFIKGILQLINPLQGKIIFSPDIKANEIGYLSQAKLAEKDFPAGVFEIVLSGVVGSMGLRPYYSRREREIAEENMNLLGIYNLRNRCFRELSGGQQRRALIARALCASRKLLVLDEAVAGLDSSSTEELYKLLTKINTELGITIISVTHDLQAAKIYASHILSIKNNVGELANAR